MIQQKNCLHWLYAIFAKLREILYRQFFLFHSEQIPIPRRCKFEIFKVFAKYHSVSFESTFSHIERRGQPAIDRRFIQRNYRVVTESRTANDNASLYARHAVCFRSVVTRVTPSTKILRLKYAGKFGHVNPTEWRQFYFSFYL